MKLLLATLLVLTLTTANAQNDTSTSIGVTSVNKDTLWLPDEPTGHLIKESWKYDPIKGTYEGIVIIMVRPDILADFRKRYVRQ